MSVDLAQLMEMTRLQLDELYQKSSAGPIPDGDAQGTAIIKPGTIWEKLLARMVRWFWWQGKVFNAEKAFLVNKISLFGIRAIRAQIYKGKSWLDQQESIILDYSKTSVVAGKVRDEIREVAPGLYLGKVYWDGKRSVDFALVFKKRPVRMSPARIFLLVLVLLAPIFLYFYFRFTRDVPVTHADIEEHFKYGSTGGERMSGIPYAIWKVLPDLFPEYLPDRKSGNGYRSLGFIYEPGKELPVGVSMRNVQGVDRVFLNCAVCHTGTVRDTPESTPRIIVGMPANTVDLEGLLRFFARCATDEKFTPQRILLEIKQQGGGNLDVVNRLLLRYYGIYVMRERLLMLRHMFEFTSQEPEFGPGRFDTFNPPKVLLNFPMDKIPKEEWVGIADFPSIWLQGPRKEMNMQLHWDGNNTSVEERNKSAAFGTGAFPTTIDMPSIERIQDWLLRKEPPAYPYPINRTLAAKGEPIYREYCAKCHGKDGRDFGGELVGKVTPIEEIKTDRHRLDSYSYELCVAQNTLYAGYDDRRFKHFRKTFGYANMPLDGVWLRAPYLHNGSVPTLRDLLDPADQRPARFFRGYDVYDPRHVGFVTDIAEERGRAYFLIDTKLPGNGNAGHEGKAYGTELTPEEKDAVVEYLKTF